MGRAVEGDDAIHVTANTSLTGFAYLMPTIIVLAMIFVALFVIGCLSFELDVRVNQWSTNPTLQSNIMAALIICILITFYILGLDIAVLVMESKNDLPNYYQREPSFVFNATVVFPIISGILVLLGISLMIASICIINSERSADTLNSCCQCLNNDPNTSVSENILFAASIVLIFWKHSFIPNNSFAYYYHSMRSCTTSAPRDPLYASKFAISYQSIILVNFYTFRYIYFALYNLQEWSSENKFQTHFISKIQDCCNRCNNVCLFILLYFVFVILSILGIIIPIAVFMVRAPVNEGATQGVTFIYSIVAAVLGALITIEIGWKSLSPPFSINDVLKRNMSRMKINPFDTNDRKWKIIQRNNE